MPARKMSRRYKELCHNSFIYVPSNSLYSDQPSIQFYIKLYIGNVANQGINKYIDKNQELRTIYKLQNTLCPVWKFVLY
jgi:hypothetical protein